MPFWYVRSARADTRPMITPCSVKDLVNPSLFDANVPKAPSSPGIDATSRVPKAPVTATGWTWTCVVDPPRNSGRCRRASGLVTLKWLLTISVYRVPPRASFSARRWSWNAWRKLLIVEAVADDRSATRPVSVPNVALLLMPPSDGLAEIDPFQYRFESVIVSELICGGRLLVTTGAMLPSGNSTPGPFCG